MLRAVLQQWVRAVVEGARFRPLASVVATRITAVAQSQVGPFVVGLLLLRYCLLGDVRGCYVTRVHPPLPSPP